MQCYEFETLAGEVLEGEPHPEAVAHLATCGRCRLLVDELGAIEHAAHQLPAFEPTPALWARLEAAALEEGLWTRRQSLAGLWQWLGLTPPPPGGFLAARPGFVAVTALMLLASATLLTIPTLDSPVRSRPADLFQVAQAELVLDSDYTARYQLHLNRLESGLLNASADRERELRVLVARPMDAVDRAIEETQAQLIAYPEDSLARDELLRLYRQKAVVLQAMSNPVWFEDGQ